MKPYRNNFILEYKSRLLDLMEDIEEKSGLDWISIIVDCFYAEKAVFYKAISEYQDDYIADYSYPNQLDSYPERITLEILHNLFMENDYIDHKKLNNCSSFSGFDLGFHIGYKGNEKGYLFLGIDQNKLINFSAEELDQFVIESGKYFNYLDKIGKAIIEENRFKELFRVTGKFHSSMNVDTVLFEIINTLKRVFPLFEYNLMLSNDAHHDKNLPIKALQFDDAEEAAMEAYVNGVVQIVSVCTGKQPILYAPLNGKQGVYGVLQVSALSTYIFQSTEIEFIRILSNTGGSALENARLYQQSQRIIEDLQLINDTSHKLNSSSRLVDIILFLRSQISRSFNADTTGFILLNNEEYSVLEGSSAFFKSQKGKVYLEFINNAIHENKESLFFSNVQGKLTKDSVPFSSLMAVPMMQADSIKGFCVALHEQPYSFTFDMFKLFQSIIHHSTLAVANSILKEELEKLVITDHLTQLFAKSHLNHEINQSMKIDDEGTFILLDIDNFKQVNDTYGHQIGDEILIQVAKLIMGNLRSTDIGARWGGEELAIYLPGVSLSVGSQVAKRLVEAVYEQTNPKITVSCGVSYWNKKRKDQVESLFNRADSGLYHAKERGKNQVVVKEDSKLII